MGKRCHYVSTEGKRRENNLLTVGWKETAGRNNNHQSRDKRKKNSSEAVFLNCSDWHIDYLSNKRLKTPIKAFANYESLFLFLQELVKVQNKRCH